MIIGKKRPKTLRAWISLPPWLVLGAVGLLAPIFIFMTLEYIDRQKKRTLELLFDKGAALIRAFEAGTRAGMLDRNWGRHHVQRLLSETARQPDIVHILITDERGQILAHSDLGKVGDFYKSGLDLTAVSRSNEVKWREVEGETGSKVFEVYKQFLPVGRPLGRMGMWGRMGPMWREMLHGREHGNMVIFVGLDMAPVEAARREDARHMTLMALILLLIGFGGMVSLFLAQAYRSTRVALSRAQAFSDNLVENMPAGLVAIDTNGQIVALNQEAERILGVSSHKVISRKADEHLPSPISKALTLSMKERRGVELEKSVKLQGHERPLHITASLLKDRSGQLLGGVAILTDLSQIRRLEREIARSQRLAAIGKLAAGVAHEIRNPLSSIKGFATYFKERYSENPNDRETARIMIQEIERLNRVIGQLLDLAREDKVVRRRLGLRDLLLESVRMIRQDAESKGVKIQLEAEDSEVILDPDRIKQALLNLYLNALDAMESGGTLRVEAERVKDTGHLIIKVSDTGYGIRQEDLPHIFDPYFTTKPSGTGLGLSIVLKIAEAHGGEVKIESEPGKGTTVSLILPLSHEPRGEGQNGQKEISSRSG